MCTYVLLEQTRLCIVIPVVLSKEAEKGSKGEGVAAVAALRILPVNANDQMAGAEAGAIEPLVRILAADLCRARASAGIRRTRQWMLTARWLSPMLAPSRIW